MTISSPPSNVVLGASEMVSISSLSKLGNIYSTSDACLTATRTSSDASVSIDGDGNAVIYSIDGSLAGDSQTVTIT